MKHYQKLLAAFYCCIKIDPYLHDGLLANEVMRDLTTIEVLREYFHNTR